MSFCFLYNVVLENHSVQNSPWGGGGGGGEGGLLPAQGLICFCYKISFLPISKYYDRKATLILSRRQQLTLVRNGGS